MSANEFWKWGLYYRLENGDEPDWPSGPRPYVVYDAPHPRIRKPELPSVCLKKGA